MKAIYCLIVFFSVSKNIYSQKSIPDTSNTCSNVMSIVSYYWKLDSLANNGFRLYAYKDLVNSKIDKVYRALLLEKLGKPNQIKRTNHGTEYIYYYYDSKKMPKEFGGPFECGYISFKFGEYDKYLSSIDEGVFDY
jgi:hypothetical protein